MHTISQLHEEIIWDFSFWVLSSLHYYVQQLQADVYIRILLRCHQKGILETINISNSNIKCSS